MQITHKQRKEQGAVFTTNTAPLIAPERIAGYTSDPKIIYWEDSVGGGDLAVAIACAKFMDQEDKIADPKKRILDIFQNQIFMNDIDSSFLSELEHRLLILVRTLSNDSSCVCNFNIAQADTVHPNFSPREAWGFSGYRTITNRSYTEVEQLPDEQTRKLFQKTYQSNLFPNNASIGKKFKLTDCGQYKAISDRFWLGGPDLRPHNVPESLQTNDIRMIDYRDEVRDMFLNASGKQAAGQKVVVLQYDRIFHPPVTVKFGSDGEQNFDDPQQAWKFYKSLCSHNFKSAKTDSLIEHIGTSCSQTLSTYCSVITSGATTGNKKELTGDVNWKQGLINEFELEEEAFIPWVNAGDIIPGGVNTNQFALLPYSQHTKALKFYLSKIPVGSSHAVPAERKAVPKWQNTIGPLLYMRHNPQFTTHGRGLAVGYSKKFAGIGQTGSAILISPLQTDGGKRTIEDYMKIVLVILNSSYGNFMKAEKAKQHNEAASMVQLGARAKNIPLFNLDIPQADILITIANRMIKSNVLDITNIDKAVYDCMPFISKSDKLTIATYLTNRISKNE